MPVDNEMYNAPGDIWWDDAAQLSFLRIAVNPARFPYFREVLTARLGMDPRGKTALDVGCGGGFLAEEFARLGCRVTGIDPSIPSLQTARAHAASSGLDITYVEGIGEDLPFADASFDIVYCCDVLEHVGDLDRVISETSRVLKPDGVYLYDTINRTFLSKLVLIKLIQEWPYTRQVRTRLHDWSMFIRPEELRAVMTKHSLVDGEVRGMRPAFHPVHQLSTFLSYRAGRSSYRELAERFTFIPCGSTSLSYMGYAVKRGNNRRRYADG